ncbi:MAG: OmpA family protein [Bacteroidetes bacterium]|nr:OmpA family protein [Bacteroidota bacterium]
MKKLSLILLSLACIFSTATMDAAKAKKSKTAKADKAFNSGKYAPAADLYKKAYAKIKDKTVKAEAAYKAAECYTKMSNAAEALNWYEKSVKSNGKNADAVLKYAQALKNNGRYDEAVAQFNAFKALEPGDERGNNGVTSSETAQQWKDKPTKYKVDNVAALNTKYFDFAVGVSNLDKNTLYFTSSRAEATGNKNDAWYGEKFYDIFKSTIDNNGKWSIPTSMSDVINTEASEGAMTFDAKGNVMYFTRCKKSDVKGQEGQCKIYKSTFDGTKWGEPELLPFNSDNYTCGQPSLSDDGTTLYFASDMPGGLGGKDIWMSKNENGSWTTPVNLSTINTTGDEMFPYIAANGKLYFASNGHPGMGGLDIFTATMENGTWGTVTNLKYPINSSYDDFGLMFNTATTGYLTSNRAGGQGEDDIYSFVVPPANFAVYGRVYDTDTKDPISGATVELFGSDGTRLSVKTQDAGTYRYELKPDVDYKISASFTGYLTQFKEVSTKGLDESKDFEKNFDFPLKSTAKPIALPEIYYDFDKFSLRPESKSSMDGLIKVLDDNPTITIKLTAHTDYRGTDQYNNVLSNKRAESAYKYLLSKGVDKARLSWEGRGKKDPLEVPNNEEYPPFKRGDVLTEQFIKGLATEELKDKANQYNRRTAFTVLSTDYVPKKKK